MSREFPLYKANLFKDNAGLEIGFRVYTTAVTSLRLTLGKGMNPEITLSVPSE